ncbi:nicotinate-nucleotide adenylyltransferase [Dysgonomonadaceae bacterium PH5-43]|nr:nicotinate-nucleotide adenylyltransferase [Dysgonomonadaceae bacterium PH5-43]
MKIGIFPGSFNPVHIGHLAIANYISEFEGYDEVWFLITPQNPLKRSKDLLDQKTRLELIEQSIVGYEKFKICTLEWDLPKPSYTINTLQKLRMLYPKYTFELVIGSDNWATIHRWKDYQVILKNFSTLVYPRKNNEHIAINHPNVRLCKNSPMIEMSASTIRAAIKAGKDVRFYLPAGVYEKVLATGFFEPEPELEAKTENIEDSLSSLEEQINSL